MVVVGGLVFGVVVVVVEDGVVVRDASVVVLALDVVVLTPDSVVRPDEQSFGLATPV